MFPSWIQSLSVVIPMTYGLRAVRRLVLDDAPLSAVASDVATTAMIAVVCLAVGSFTFRAAFNYSRQRGTLSQY